MLRDRVGQSTTTAGTGAYELTGLLQKHRTFASQYAAGAKFPYYVERDNIWEANEGTLTIPGVGNPTVSRDRLLGSNSGAVINWPDNAVKTIIVDAPAETFGPLGSRYIFAVAAGTATALTAAIDVPFAVFKNGAILRLLIVLDSTGAATLTVTAAGVVGAAKAIQKVTGQAIGKLELVANTVMEFVFNEAADAWILVGGVNVSTGKHLIPLRAAAMRGAITNGATLVQNETATNKVNVTSLDFDPNTKQFGHIEWMMPKSYDGGVVNFLFRWMAASGSGGVAVSLQALARQDGDDLDVAYGTAITVTDTLIAVNKEQASVVSANVTPAGSPAGDKNLYFRIAREVADGADTLAANLKLIGVGLLINVKAGNDN